MKVKALAVSCICVTVLAGCAGTSSSVTPRTESVTTGAPTQSPAPTDTRSGMPAPTDTATGAGTTNSAATGAGGWSIGQCDTLQGNGTINDPYQLGEITGPVEFANCAPLVPGAIDCDFSFTLPSAPGSAAYAGAQFTLTANANGPVYAYIITPEGEVLHFPTFGPGSQFAFWTYDGSTPNGFYQKISDLDSGTYVLQEEDTKALANGTSYYNILINPSYQ